MTPISEQRIPWLRGERRSAGGADAVAARDRPPLPRRPLPSQLPRRRIIALLVVASSLLTGAVAIFLGPLADRCGPVGDIKRCDGPPVPASSNDKPWTAAFESVVPVTGDTALPATPPATSQVTRSEPAAARLPVVATARPKAAVRQAPVKAKEPVPPRRSARESRTGGRDSSEDEPEESSSDIEDE